MSRAFVGNRGPLLGVLRAGATYVPLDPGYPLERSPSLADTGADVLLTQTSLVASPAARASSLVCG